MSLISGLVTSKDEIDRIKSEFLRLDQDKNGSLSREELKNITHTKWCQKI